MSIPSRLVEGLKIPVLIDCDECGHPGMHLSASEVNERCYLVLRFTCPSCNQPYSAAIDVATLARLDKED